MVGLQLAILAPLQMLQMKSFGLYSGRMLFNENKYRYKLPAVQCRSSPLLC